MINSNNYYTVQAFMRTELDLKGLELQVYAIIYGFSQTKGTYFTGSTAYLEKWTGCTRRGIFKVLKSLEEKNLIRRYEKIQGVNNIVLYYVNLEKISNELSSQQAMNSVHNSYELSSQQAMNSVPQSCELSSTTHYNINNNIDDNKDKEIIPFLQEIIDYLNGKANTRFTTRSKSTKQHINARFKEGYTLDDFKKVIDNKVSEWYGTDFQKYLCPETLFGTKFEKYLNQQTSKVEQTSSVDKYKFVINDF